MTTFEVLDTTTGLKPSFVSVKPTAVDIDSTDRSLVGSYTLSITAITSSGSKVQQHNFDVSLIDSCTTSFLVEYETLTPIYESTVPSTLAFTSSIKAFTDSVSDSLLIPENCGSITYTLVDDKDEAAPASVAVSYSSADNTVTVEADLSTWTQPGTFQYKLVAQLKDYAATVPVRE